MRRQNKSRYAVLGLLAIEPMSGYDIKCFVAGVIGHFWNESYGQIYPVLKALEKEGLVGSRSAKRQGRPRRVVYSITRKGREQLRDWLEDAPEPDAVRREVVLKVFLGANAAPAVVRRHLEAYKAAHIESLRRLRDAEAESESSAGRPEQAYWMATLRLGIRISETMSSWCEETLRAIPADTVPNAKGEGQ